MYKHNLGVHSPGFLQGSQNDFWPNPSLLLTPAAALRAQGCCAVTFWCLFPGLQSTVTPALPGLWIHLLQSFLSSFQCLTACSVRTLPWTVHFLLLHWKSIYSSTFLPFYWYNEQILTCSLSTFLSYTEYLQRTPNPSKDSNSVRSGWFKVTLFQY